MARELAQQQVDRAQRERHSLKTRDGERHATLGEVERDLVDVGDRPSGLGGTQRTRVAGLRAERDPEVHAGREQRVVATVRRRQLPQPRHDAERDEAFVDAPAQLAHRGHRLAQIGPRDAAQAGRMGGDDGSDLVVVDQRSFGPIPGRRQSQADASFVHGRDRRLERQRRVEARHPEPAAQRVEHLVVRMAQRRVLHPDVDHPGRH
jgi:hypothetical protein